MEVSGEPEYYEEGFEPFHVGVACSSCFVDEDIYGSVYECRDCPRPFALCEECFLTENFIGQHATTHTMRLSHSPLDLYAGVWFNEKCDNCLSEHYDGVQHQCEECGVVICDRCSELPELPHLKGHYRQCSHPLATRILAERTRWTYVQFKAASIKMQAMFARTLGSRPYDELDTYVSDSWKNLGRKIGFAVYNKPSNDASQFGYTPEQEEHISALRKSVMEINRKNTGKAFKSKGELVRINFVFIGFYTDEQINMIPLIRLHTWNDKLYFIEPQGRIYDSWEDFLSHNKLPNCTICIPNEGIYKLGRHNSVQLTFRGSAEQDLSRKLGRGGNIAATIAAVAATSVAIASLFTPVGPVVAGAALIAGIATGIYGSTRSTYALVDRGIHGESINPFDNRESFFCWLSIVASAFSVSSTTGILYAAQVGATGGQMGVTMKMTVDAAIFGSLGVSGVGIVASGVNMGAKIVEGKVPTPLELFQFSSSILFFANGIVHVQTAQNIVKSVQDNLTVSNDAHTGDQTVTHKKLENLTLGDVSGPDVKTRGQPKSRPGKIPPLRTLNSALARNASMKSMFGRASINKRISRSSSVDGENMHIRAAAVQAARLASQARPDCDQTDKLPKTTIMLKPEHAIEAEILHIWKETGYSGEAMITLPTIVYAYDVTIDNAKHLTHKVEVRTPTFKVIDGRPIQFVAAESCIAPVAKFPTAVPLIVNPDSEELPIYVAPSNYKQGEPSEVYYESKASKNHKRKRSCVTM